MVEDNEDIQDLECQCRNRAEVDRPGFMKMVPDEGQPCLGASSRRIGLHHVFSDGIGMGGIEAEENEMVMDTLCRPEPILRTQLLDELSHLGINLAPSSFPGFPSPVESESLSMPFQNCCWLHQVGRRSPAVPVTGQE